LGRGERLGKLGSVSDAVRFLPFKDLSGRSDFWRVVVEDLEAFEGLASVKRDGNVKREERGWEKGLIVRLKSVG
jgi:hypothetical protein